MSPEEEAKYYKQAYVREKAARKEAERILESKAEELYQTNKKLLSLNASLEQNLFERTEQIKEAEEQYRKLVETANDVIFRVDLKGNFTYVNHTGIRLSGYDLKDLIGRNFISLVTNEFHEDMHHLYMAQLKSETESTYYEYKIINARGEEIWLGQNVQLIFKDGFPVGYLAVARNITERVQSDNALRESNEKYKKLFEGAFDGVIRLDSKRRFLEWNTKIESMLGYSSHELEGMHIKDILYEEDQATSLTYLRKLVRNGYYTNYIGQVITKSGKIIDIEVNSRATYENGKISGSIENVRDITERVSLEKAIVRSEEKYRGIIENLEFGLLEVDKEGFITKAYPSFCKLTGYKSDELTGTNPYDMLHPDFFHIMDRKMQERSSGVADVYEVKIRQKSGEYKWVIISGAPFYDELGNYQGSMGVHLDISAQKKMQSDLKRANEIAQASSKAKELFLANMSHEIRTPLNAVIGLSHLLKETELEEQQTEYVANINNAAQSLLLLVNDILDITKIESGKLELNPTRFNLPKTMGTILSSTSYPAEQKKLSLDFKIDQQLDEFYIGDELRISQILINLINNAVKFTAEGGVTVNIDKIQDAGNKHKIKIAVSDTGKGIAKEALAKIFEDFSQEDNTISKEYGGTGLGLSISKKLVSLLGGRLEVTSELGVGTTFYFSFELERAVDNTEGTKSESEQIINWQKINILTVEDNPVNQFVVQSTIKSWDGETDIANNGQEAIEMLAENEYDIILMDMQMPVMDGIAATKFIRQEMKSDIPIIAFTANALKKEMERCFAVGMNDYITKPFQEDQLKAKILNLVLKGYGKEAFELRKAEKQKAIEAPFFTCKRLEDLSRGNDEFVTRMIQIFCEDGRKQLNQMIDSDDPELIGRLAHKLKPSIDYVSNEEMKSLVRQIEQKSFVDQPRLLTEFTAQLDRLISEANAYLTT